MSKKLKIYACSGVGETGNGYYAYWTDGTNPADNTQAVNTLLARINSLQIEVKYLTGLTNEEKIERLNYIDLYTVCLDYAKRFANNNEQLLNAERYIGSLVADKVFNLQSTSEEDHKSHISAFIGRDVPYVTGEYPEFMDWWNEYVMARNVVGLNQEQRAAVKKAERDVKISGIGASGNWQNDKNIGNYLLNGAMYFTYFYFTNDQLKQLPNLFTKKRNIQNKLYNYCAAYFVKTYGSKQEMDNIIRSGIIQKYGHTPEEVCEAVVKGEITIEGVGAIVWTATAIASIIAAAISATVAIIVAIINAIKEAKVAKYQAITEEQANKGCPNPEDFKDYNEEKGTWEEVKSNWIPLAAIGVALVWLFKNR